MTHCEDDSIALAERHDLRPRLHPRSLLGENELPSNEVTLRLGEKNRHLDREDVFSINVLVQAVEVF
jgi:hypothetical protein